MIDLRLVEACSDLDLFTAHLSDILIAKRGKLWYVSLGSTTYVDTYLSKAMEVAFETEKGDSNE